MKSAPPKCFHGTLLYTEPVLFHQQLVIVLVARICLLCILEVLIQQRRRRHHHVFARTALGISSACRILVRNPSAPVQHHFPEILFRRNMRMGRESFNDLLTEALNMFSERTLVGSHTVTFASEHNPFVAKFDDPMTDG